MSIKQIFDQMLISYFILLDPTLLLIISEFQEAKHSFYDFDPSIFTSILPFSSKSSSSSIRALDCLSLIFTSLHCSFLLHYHNTYFIHIPQSQLLAASYSLQIAYLHQTNTSQHSLLFHSLFINWLKLSQLVPHHQLYPVKLVSSNC